MELTPEYLAQVWRLRFEDKVEAAESVRVVWLQNVVKFDNIAVALQLSQEGQLAQLSLCFGLYLKYLGYLFDGDAPTRLSVDGKDHVAERPRANLADEFVLATDVEFHGKTVCFCQRRLLDVALGICTRGLVRIWCSWHTFVVVCLCLVLWCGVVWYSLLIISFVWEN